MTDKTKFIIMRHGTRPRGANGSKEDRCSLESLQDIYETIKKSSGGFYTDPRETFLDYSGTERTLVTGLATIAAGTGYSFPEDYGSLMQLKESLELGRGLEVKVDERIDSRDIKVSRQALKRLGEEGYIRHWVNNPYNDEIDGKEVTPYNKIIERGREYLGDRLNYALRENKKLGVIATHAAIAESLALSLINSPSKRTLENIGGLFDTGDFIIMDVEKDSDRSYKANLQGQKNFDVDLGGLI